MHPPTWKKHFEDLGYSIVRCEIYNHYGGNYKDLMGFADFIAFQDKSR